MYLIGDASQQSGVNIETIRYYEREGVVPKPDRSPAGRRVYSKDGIAKLRFVRRCRDLGFPMPSIKVLLSLTSTDDRTCDEVKGLADAQITEIEQKIKDLRGLKSALKSLSNNCASGSAQCPMLDALMSDHSESF